MSLMDDTVEMVRSNKGGAKIIHRGFMYTVHKKKIGGIRWRCARRILHCKGSITTGPSGPPVINLPHNHVPDMHAVAMARCRSFNDSDTPETYLDPVPTGLHPTSSQEFDTSIVKEEYDEKFASNSTSPSPSQSSMKSILKTKTTPVKNQKPASTKPKTSPLETDSEVCLRWNSHHSNMQTTFPFLLDNEKYVDVTLASEGQTLKCHRLILSSCSDFFDDMLKTVPAHNHPIIFLHNIEFWQIKSLIDFMYKGEVNVDQSKLESLLKAAEVLQVKGLAGKSNVKNEETNKEIPEEVKDIKPEFMEEDSIDDFLEPDSPAFVSNPTDEEEFKPYYYYKKKMNKKKKKNVPAPGQLKTVPCNLRGTKSRPNIKQPVFYDPDFPDHDPNRSVSPPTPDKDSSFHIDNVKIEPIDIETPDSPSYYNALHEQLAEARKPERDETDEPPEKKSAIMIIKKTDDVQKNQEQQQTIDDNDESPVIIEKLSDDQPELVVEKNDDDDDDKKFTLRIMKTNEINGSSDGEKRYLTVKKLPIESDDANTPKNRLSRSEMGFKKIKLTTTESVLQKLAKKKDEDNENDKSGVVSKTEESASDNCDNKDKDNSNVPSQILE